MAPAFMGYVLPLGQMSFWGATAITKFFLQSHTQVNPWRSGYEGVIRLTTQY